LLAASVLLCARVAVAHEMSMAELELRELGPGEFFWQWTSSGNNEAGDGLSPHWPDQCNVEANMLRCGPDGLTGTLSVGGVGDRYSAAMVKVIWQDGKSSVYTITAAQPEARLYGSADDRRGFGEIARAYTVLGVEHILSGFDHLLFVLALLFLVGFNRRLLLTITAFTLAHSLTLALSALGLVTLRSPPVEATIALSIALVAAEALNREATLARRWPALVAFLFGLVHGLGFAGALQEIGLPQKHLSVALLTFNVGVELGQLLVVAAAYATYRLLKSRPAFVAARAPALYAIGAMAAYWSIGRIVTIIS
jgi:hydrogenase/urease accessory protein HupE